jgi:hypothetical protein
MGREIESRQGKGWQLSFKEKMEEYLFKVNYVDFTV